MLNSILGSFTVVSDRHGVTGDGCFIFKSLAEALAQKTLKVRAQYETKTNNSSELIELHQHCKVFFIVC